MSMVSIVVTPREQFSCAADRLKTLLARTPAEAEIVYVANGAAPAQAEGLKAMLDGRTAKFIHGPEFLAQNAARNLGAQHARSDADFYVFLDNDVVVEPGWLEAMVRCADETGAGVVGPLMQEGNPADRIVHMIGGVYREIDTPNGRVAFERHFRGHRRLADLDSPPVRRSVDYVEGHCMLVSRAAFQACAGFDEHLVTMYEYIDMSLRAREAGFSAFVDPAAVATYDNNLKLQVDDVFVFLKRWNIADTRATFDHFAAKRGLRRDCELIVYAENFVRQHRGHLRLFDQGAEWMRPHAGAKFPVPQTVNELEDVLSLGGFSVSGCAASAWLIMALRPFYEGLSPPQAASARIGFSAAQTLIEDGADLALVAAALIYPFVRSGRMAKNATEVFLKDAKRHWEFDGLGPLLNSTYAMEIRLADALGSGFGATSAEALRPALVLAALIGAQNARTVPAAFAPALEFMNEIGFRQVVGACRAGSPWVQTAAE